MSWRFWRPAVAFAAFAAVSFGSPARAAERDMVIVGSTFLAPFINSVIDNLVTRKVIAAPKTEFAGTGRGVNEFCKGREPFAAPDVVAMSRRIRAAELDLCRDHHGDEVIEIQLGLSALVLVARRDDADFDMSLKDFYRSVAAELPRDVEFVQNRLTTWNAVEDALPALPIRVLVPAPGLGSRGFFEDRFLEAACRGIFEIKTIFIASERVKQCITLRRDGRIGEIGIPYAKNLREAMVAAPKGTVAVAPLNMAKEMLDVVKVLPFDGVAPTQESIANRQYAFVRPLYVYVKRANIKDYNGQGPVRGLRELITELTRERTVGPNGYLVKEGLEPLTTVRREAGRRAALRLEVVER